VDPYAAEVKRVLLTGMSGTGKSTVIAELAARGYKTVDTDYDGWSEVVAVQASSGETGLGVGLDQLWREDRIAELLATDDAEVLFVSGCAPNQSKFYGQFDHIVLLSAPAPVMTERLATRTDNPYGKDADELRRVLALKQTVEPMLRRAADLEIDTSVSPDQVVERILGLVSR
jgi:shikimate kinase